MNIHPTNENLERILRDAACYVHHAAVRRELVIQSKIYSGDFAAMRQDYTTTERSLVEELASAEARRKAFLERELASTRARIAEIQSLEERQNTINEAYAKSGKTAPTLAEAYRQYRPEPIKNEPEYFAFLPETA